MTASLNDILNEAQRRAVETPGGPLMILAGPGSGKTRVIAHRIAYLVREQHVHPWRILAVTFTNKAAREMRERVGKLIQGPAAEGLTVCTFHALGLKFLQIEHARAGLRRGFSVLDADDSQGLIKELAPKSIKNDALWALQSLVSRAKNEGFTPEQAAQAAAGAREREAADIYAAYQKRLAAFNAVDFDDLIRLPLRILENDDEARGAWQERIRYLLLDEYQDTNTAQYRLVRALAGERGMFTAVGDDDQSIYAWRGANPENLGELSRDYPKLRVIKLEQNYRCARRILRVANALIANNDHLFEKKLWSEGAEGAPIRSSASHASGRSAASSAGCSSAKVAPPSELVAQAMRLASLSRTSTKTCASAFSLSSTSARSSQACAWRRMASRSAVRSAPRSSLARSNRV